MNSNLHNDYHLSVDMANVPVLRLLLGWLAVVFLAGYCQDGQLLMDWFAAIRLAVFVRVFVCCMAGRVLLSWLSVV